MFKTYVLDKKKLNYYTVYAKAELNKNNWSPPNITTQNKSQLKSMNYNKYQKQFWLPTNINPHD